jgi:hypothetical protein
MEKKVIEIEIQDNSKTLKQQYKEAVLEVQKLADAFGATSIEVQNASKRAAELKDQIEDVNDAIQAQKGEGAFIALGKSLSSVASGFSAVEGAMGLVGAESEDVQKAMLRVQSAMALAQGLEGLEDAGRAFKQLGVVIKGTTIFQAAYNFVVYGTISATKAQTIATNIQTGSTVGATVATKALRIAMLAVPIVAIVAGILALANAMGVFGDATEDAEKKQAKLDAQLAKTNTEIERQKKASTDTAELMDALNTEELINAKKRGASEEELTKIKKEQQKERLKDLKQEYDEATKLYSKMSKTGSTKEFEAAEELFNEAFKKYNDFRLEVEGETADEIYEKRKTAVDKANQLRNSELEKIKEYYKNAKDENEARLRTEQEQEEFVINDKFNTQIALFKKYGKDTTELEIAQLNEINNVRLKYQGITDEAEKKRKEKELEAIKEANQKELEAIKTANNLKKQQEQEFQAQIEEIDETNFQNKLQKSMTEEQYELELVRQKYFTLEEQAKDNAEQLAIIEEAKQAEIDKIEKTYAEKAKVTQQQRLDLILKYAQTFGQVMSSLNGLLNANDEERLKSVKKGSKEEDSIKRKMFERDKKLRIVQTVIDTASNVVTSVRNGGGIPTGIPFGIAAATMGALQIAAISKTSYGSGDTNVTPPSTGVIAPNLNVVGNTGINQLATLQQQPVKAYVVSNDITSAQQFDLKVQQTSQL